MRRGALSAILLVSAVLTPGAQAPAEWPQLFGPARNATARASIPAGATLSLAWKRPMPTGGSGITVAGDRLYTLGSDGGQDLLFAIDTATGREAWRFGLGATHADAVNGPSSTPAIAADLVLSVSSGCALTAVNRSSGQVAWTQDIGTAFSSRFARRGGCGMSPLLAGPRVVVVTGATEGPRLAAFEVATGRLAWTTEDLPNGHNVAPGWTEADGGAGLVLYHHVGSGGASGITAVHAGTGAVVWQVDGDHGQSDATPVTLPRGRVLVERWPHVTLYDIATRTPVWTSTDIVAGRSPAVLHGDHLYTFGGQSSEFLTSVNAATGRVNWTSRIYRGHSVLAGDTLVVLSESAGFVRLVAADPSGYRELAKLAVLNPGARTGTPASFAGGRIFVRNLDELAAVEVRSR